MRKVTPSVDISDWNRPKTAPKSGIKHQGTRKGNPYNPDVLRATYGW